MNNHRMPNDEETAAAAASPQYLHMLVEHSCCCLETQRHEKKEELAALQLEPGENWLCWSEQVVSKDDDDDAEDNDDVEEEEEGKKRTNEENARVNKLEIISAAREPDRIPTTLEQIQGNSGRQQRRCCYLCLDVDGAHVTVKDMRRSPENHDDTHDNDGWTPYLMSTTTTTTTPVDISKLPKERLEKRKMRWLQNEWFLCLVDDNHATTKIVLQYACLPATTPSKTAPPESPSSRYARSLMEQAQNMAAARVRMEEEEEPKVDDDDGDDMAVASSPHHHHETATTTTTPPSQKSVPAFPESAGGASTARSLEEEEEGGGSSSAQLLTPRHPNRASEGSGGGGGDEASPEAKGQTKENEEATNRHPSPASSSSSHPSRTTSPMMMETEGIETQLPFVQKSPAAGSPASVATQSPDKAVTATGKEKSNSSTGNIPPPEFSSSLGGDDDEEENDNGDDGDGDESSTTASESELLEQQQQSSFATGTPPEEEEEEMVSGIARSSGLLTQLPSADDEDTNNNKNDEEDDTTVDPDDEAAVDPGKHALPERGTHTSTEPREEEEEAQVVVPIKTVTETADDNNKDISANDKNGESSPLEEPHPSVKPHENPMTESGESKATSAPGPADTTTSTTSSLQLQLQAGGQVASGDKKPEEEQASSAAAAAKKDDTAVAEQETAESSPQQPSTAVAESAKEGRPVRTTNRIDPSQNAAAAPNEKENDDVDSGTALAPEGNKQQETAVASGDREMRKETDNPETAAVAEEGKVETAPLTDGQKEAATDSPTRGSPKDMVVDAPEVETTKPETAVDDENAATGTLSDQNEQKAGTKDGSPGGDAVADAQKDEKTAGTVDDENVHTGAFGDQKEEMPATEVGSGGDAVVDSQGGRTTEPLVAAESEKRAAEQNVAGTAEAADDAGEGKDAGPKVTSKPAPQDTTEKPSKQGTISFVASSGSPATDSASDKGRIADTEKAMSQPQVLKARSSSSASGKKRKNADRLEDHEEESTALLAGSQSPTASQELLAENFDKTLAEAQRSEVKPSTRKKSKREVTRGGADESSPAAAPEPEPPASVVNTPARPTRDRRAASTRSTRGKRKAAVNADDEASEQPVQSATKRTARTPQARSSSRRVAPPILETEADTDGEVRVLVTGLDLDTKQKKMAKALGVVLIENIADAHNATHVIASDEKRHMRRTPKLMIALCCTKNIVTLKWLVESISAKEILPCDEYLLLGDKEAEKKYKFSMKKTLKIVESRLQEESRLFDGWSVYVCKGVAGNRAPEEKELRLMIEAAGGSWLTTCSKKGLDFSKVLIITSDPEKEKQVSVKAVAGAFEKGAEKRTCGWLFDAMMKQETDL